MLSRTDRAVSFVPALAWLLLPVLLVSGLVVSVTRGQDAADSTPAQPAQPDGDAQPQPEPEPAPPARLAYRFDLADERRD